MKRFFSQYNKYKSFINTSMKNLKIEGTNIVRTEKQALEIIKILEDHEDRMHSWDTEVIDLDIKN